MHRLQSRYRSAVCRHSSTYWYTVILWVMPCTFEVLRRQQNVVFGTWCVKLSSNLFWNWSEDTRTIFCSFVAGGLHATWWWTQKPVIVHKYCAIYYSSCYQLAVLLTFLAKTTSIEDLQRLNYFLYSEMLFFLKVETKLWRFALITAWPHIPIYLCTVDYLRTQRNSKFYSKIEYTSLE